MADNAFARLSNETCLHLRSGLTNATREERPNFHFLGPAIKEETWHEHPLFAKNIIDTVPARPKATSTCPIIEVSRYFSNVWSYILCAVVVKM